MLVETTPLRWAAFLYSYGFNREVVVKPPGLEVKALLARYVEIKEGSLRRSFPQADAVGSTPTLRGLDDNRNWEIYQNLQHITIL